MAIHVYRTMFKSIFQITLVTILLITPPVLHGGLKQEVIVQGFVILKPFQTNIYCSEKMQIFVELFNNATNTLYFHCLSCPGKETLTNNIKQNPSVLYALTSTVDVKFFQQQKLVTWTNVVLPCGLCTVPSKGCLEFIIEVEAPKESGMYDIIIEGKSPEKKFVYNSIFGGPGRLMKPGDFLNFKIEKVQFESRKDHNTDRGKP